MLLRKDNRCLVAVHRTTVRIDPGQEVSDHVRFIPADGPAKPFCRVLQKGDVIPAVCTMLVNQRRQEDGTWTGGYEIDVNKNIVSSLSHWSVDMAVQEDRVFRMEEDHFDPPKAKVAVKATVVKQEQPVEAVS